MIIVISQNYNDPMEQLKLKNNHLGTIKFGSECNSIVIKGPRSICGSHLNGRGLTAGSRAVSLRLVQLLFVFMQLVGTAKAQTTMDSDLALISETFAREIVFMQEMAESPFKRLETTLLNLNPETLMLTQPLTEEPFLALGLLMGEQSNQPQMILAAQASSLVNEWKKVFQELKLNQLKVLPAGVFSSDYALVYSYQWEGRKAWAAWKAPSLIRFLQTKSPFFDRYWIMNSNSELLFDSSGQYIGKKQTLSSSLEQFLKKNSSVGSWQEKSDQGESLVSVIKNNKYLFYVVGYQKPESSFIKKNGLLMLLILLGVTALGMGYYWYKDNTKDIAKDIAKRPNTSKIKSNKESIISSDSISVQTPISAQPPISGARDISTQSPASAQTAISTQSPVSTTPNFLAQPAAEDQSPFNKHSMIFPDLQFEKIINDWDDDEPSQAAVTLSKIDLALATTPSGSSVTASPAVHSEAHSETLSVASPDLPSLSQSRNTNHNHNQKKGSFEAKQTQEMDHKINISQTKKTEGLLKYPILVRRPLKRSLKDDA